VQREGVGTRYGSRSLEMVRSRAIPKLSPSRFKLSAKTPKEHS
jgi:hypothetical protein